MKLAVLGGGGVRSPFLAKSIALGAKETGITETVFMDIDEEKLYIYGKIAKVIANKINPDLAFYLTTDADEALKDADFVITTIRAEGDSGRVFDERTALNEGVLGQETTGAGGFAMSLRSIHTLIDYCEKAKRLSKPDAPIFNFTNPSGLVTQALRTMGYSNVYGVCDAPSGFLRQVRDMLGEKEVTMECFGLNHLSWFTNFKLNGKDITDRVISHPKLYTDTEMRLFGEEILPLSDNLIPNEYLYFFHYRDRAVNSVLSSEKTRGETILEINEHMLSEMRTIDIDNDFDKAFYCFMSHYAMRENSYFSIESGKARTEKFPVPTVEEYIAQPENGSYAAVALDYIKAKNTGKGVQMVLSVPNEGALGFLADDDVCEITCTVDANGVHPHKIENVPEMQKNLICAVKHYENLTVEAIMEKSRRKAVKALTVHPLVCSYPVAEKLVDAYSERYEKYIGKWSD
ncbi:MAG: glycoside hydrolase [Clostridia bacterium]|nr:glycoside hydrolase [Clostridia bacterium]